MNYELREINLCNKNKFVLSDDIFEMRSNISNVLLDSNKINSDVTIIVTAYNRIEKTKMCIESIIKYSTDVDYNLILIDNGSDDDMLEYLRTVKYDNKHIIHISKNITSSIPYQVIDINSLSKYVAVITNDIVVTENWLSNLIKVADSDKKVGMVVPMSSNVSNLQCFNMDFCDYNDMQEKAKAFNVSDPTKWHERMRLITLGAFFRKECLMTIGWPCFDCGFVHDFGDDDLSFRVRRSGYKLILAKDTWIHHNHNIFNLEDKKADDFQKSIEIGRKNFSDKYFGIDAWDDVNNYVFNYIEDDLCRPEKKENISILGVDVKCGTPILDIKNILRKYKIYTPECYAYTEEAKYFTDLQTVCGSNNVFCGSHDKIINNVNKKFDYIIVGREINTYSDYESMISSLNNMLNKKGQLFFSLKNTNSIFTLLKLLGYNISDINKIMYIQVDDFYGIMKKQGYNIELISYETFDLNSDLSNFLNNIIRTYADSNVSIDNLTRKLSVKNYWFKIIREE